MEPNEGASRIIEHYIITAAVLFTLPFNLLTLFSKVVRLLTRLHPIHAPLFTHTLSSLFNYTLVMLVFRNEG